MYVLLIVVCPFVLFLLNILLSILLRYMNSDCPFGIFKLFLHALYHMEDSITSKSDKGEESPIKINTLREVKLQSLSCIICVVFCRSLFVLFNFSTCFLSRFMASYPFGIFKHFRSYIKNYIMFCRNAMCLGLKIDMHAVGYL
jgi:hypothetical protein